MDIKKSGYDTGKFERKKVKVKEELLRDEF